MSAAAVAAWTKLLGDLQALLDAAGPTDVAAALSAVQARLDSTALRQPPHAAWKTLVQDVKVTLKLALMCAQAQQQHAPLPTQHCIAVALREWLAVAASAAATHPKSVLAVCVWQQLQESYLLQHLAATVSYAADELTAVVDLSAEEGEAATSGSDAGSASRKAGDTAQRANNAMNFAGVLLVTFKHASSCALGGPAGSRLEGVFATPAAARLSLAVLKACSLPHMRQAVHMEYVLRVTHDAILGMAALLASGGAKHAIKGLPDRPSLLLSPDLASCLAFGISVAILGLDLAARLGSVVDSKRGSRAADDSTAGSSGGSSSSSRTGTSPLRPSQPAQQGSSACPAALRHPDCSLKAAIANSNSGLASNRADLLANDLTPLSASLFDLLGVTMETALRMVGTVQNAGQISFQHQLAGLCEAYCELLTCQVEVTVRGGVLRNDLLLQVEAHMLLVLLVQQLAAGLAPKYHKTLAYRLSLSGLLGALGSVVVLEAPYTGPQLALQVHVLQQTLPPDSAEQPNPSPVQAVLSPTAAFLNEMLTLLTQHCLHGVETLQAAKTEQQQVAGVSDAASSTAADPGASTPACGSAGSTSNATGHVSKPSLSCVENVVGNQLAVLVCLECLADLLVSSVLPQHSKAAETTGVPGSSGATASGEALAAMGAPPAVTAGSGLALQGAAWTDMLHAQDTILLHAADIMRAIEGVVREACVSSAVNVKSAVFLHGVAYYASVGLQDTAAGSGPLVLLALAAGPGSRVWRQFCGLLCTLLKAIPALHREKAAQQEICSRAARAASALVAGAAVPEKQPQQAQQPARDTVSLLPCLVLLGRCCLSSAGQLQDTSQSGMQDGKARERMVQAVDNLAPVQQLLKASSSSRQLCAAGYTPGLVVQQLEHLRAAVEVLNCNRNADEEVFATVVQELCSTGLALCSFAVPNFCNNPECSDMSGPSERLLVTGHSCLCSRCRVARFCSRVCLRAHWKQHQPVCAALVAAAATADTTTASAHALKAAPP